MDTLKMGRKAFEKAMNFDMRTRLSHKVEESLFLYLARIMEAVLDHQNPCLGLNVTRRPDGGYLAIIKRETDAEEQVIMSYGDDFGAALMKLNHSMMEGDWKKNLTWEQRQKQKKQKN